LKVIANPGYGREITCHYKQYKESLCQNQQSVPPLGC
jgi:hypothetical protein